MTMKPWVHPAIVVASSLVLGGCAAKQPPATQVDKQPWEVRVESPLDTIQVTPAPTATGAGTQTANSTGTEPSTGPQTTGSGGATTSTATGAPIVETPVVTETAAAMTSSAMSSAPSTTPAVNTPVPDAKDFIPGWRVQIFASTVMSTSEAAAAKARHQFTESVYVEYQAPFYKVRVGNFLTKEDARHMMNRAKAENYGTAWVVEDLVLRPEH
jgi:cell division protein FtsN